MYEDFGQSRSPRVAIYSQDGFGLGHMRRNNSIASQLLQMLPEASVLTLSDSQLGQVFGTTGNHDYLKLPSIVKDGPGQWRATNLSMPFAGVHAMRRDLIRSAVLTFWPDILLVDHMPHGAMGELVPALDALRAAGADTKIVLGLRDILDAPQVVKDRWRVEGAFETIEHYYDLVLVYGMREVFDVAEQYYFPPNIAEKLCYCGYVCTPETARYAARARAQSLAGAQKGSRLIVAMAGGGADAYPMMSGLLAALPEILAHQPCVLVLITGPFMPAELRHDLETRGRGLPVRVHMSVSDTLSYLEAAIWSSRWPGITLRSRSCVLANAPFSSRAPAPAQNSAPELDFSRPGSGLR